MTQEERFEQVVTLDAIDASLGFERLEEGASREAWLVSMHPTITREEDGALRGKSGVDFYFIEDDASSFKVTVYYQPYFYIACRPKTESSVEEWLLKKYEGSIARIERGNKEDLKLPNHLLGYQRTFLKLFFHNVQDLLSVRREVMPIINEAKKKLDARDAYADVLANSAGQDAGGGEGGGMHDIESFGPGSYAGATGSSSRPGGAAVMDLLMEEDAVDDKWTGGRAKNAKGMAHNERGRGLDPQECMIDIREYDVPYYLRVAIDNGTYLPRRPLEGPR